MMEFFKLTYRIFALLGIGLLMYDLVYFWMIEATFNIRSLLALWTDMFGKENVSGLRHFVTSIVGPQNSNAVLDTPAPAILFFAAIIFYLIYRVIFSIRGGKGGGGYRYQSRH